MDSFECRGEWWIPKYPDLRAFGHLSFDDEAGAMLKVNGSNLWKAIAGGEADSNVFNAAFSGNQTKIILGDTDQGKITLYLCQSKTVHIGKGTSYSYAAKYVFIEHHFSDEESILFDGIAVEFTYLPYWLEDYSGSEYNFLHDCDGKFVGVEYKYVQTEMQKYQFNNMSVEFDILFRPHQSHRKYRFTETPFVVLKHEEKRQFESFQDTLYLLRTFLEFCIDRAMNVESLNGYIENKAVKIKFRGRDRVTSREPKIKADMILTYSDMEGSFGEYFQAWMDKSELLEPIYENYLISIHEPGYRHTSFLLLSQALEAYHRRFHGGQYMSEDDYKEIAEILKDAIPDSLHNDHKQSLKSTIKYGYQFSLRKRLKELLRNILEPYSDTLSLFIDDIDVFRNRLVNTRNYLTHYDHTSQDEMISTNAEYDEYVYKMKLILLLCFFIELGISPAKAKAVIERNRHFQYWAI